MFTMTRVMASRTMCMQVPRRTKSVNRNEPGPKMSMWVLLPMGEAKLNVTESMSDMTKGMGLQPNSSAC